MSIDTQAGWGLSLACFFVGCNNKLLEWPYLHMMANRTAIWEGGYIYG